MKDFVWGVAVLNNKLHVLMGGQVQVHTTTNYTLLRCLSVPGLHEYHAQDLAACQRNNCLYISDSGNKCIHKLPVDGPVSKWMLPDEPCGLSVTLSGALLVVCLGASRRLVFMSVESGKLRMLRILLAVSYTHLTLPTKRIV